MRALIAPVFVALAFLVGCTNAEPATPQPVTPAPVVVAKPTGLDIPKISVHVEGITELTLDASDAMEIPKDAGVVGWYPLGPAPGEVGPAILTGHVDYRGVPGVFSRLHELEAGDPISVPRADGTTATFVVYAVHRYAKDEFPTEQVYGNTNEPVLRLITCGGELDRATRSYEDNVVVSARLA